MRFNFVVSALSIVMVGFLAVAPAWTQLSTTATVNGTVLDASGAVTPGATISIRNEATQSAATTQSNSDGSFVLTGLEVGSYTVTISKAGFRTFRETQLVLHPATVATGNTTLTPGEVGTSVSVLATPAEVQTTTAETSNLVSDTQIGSLPLNGRNFQALAALMPGVVNQAAGSALGTGGYATSNTLFVNGQTTNTTFYALDGVWNENTGNMTQTAITPNPDTLEEVRVLQNNYSAKYSLLGGSVVLLQTKSGGAKFHASAYEYFRNNDLNSRNFFTPT